MGLALARIVVLLPLALGQVDADEQVVFYPSCGWLDASAATWTLAVRGCVFEPEADSLRRGLLAAALRRALDVEQGTDEAARFERRIRALLVDHERGKRLTVQIGSKAVTVGPSGPDGLLSGTVALRAGEAERLLAARPGGGRWLGYRAVLPEGDARRFFGRVRLIEPAGLSCVSDIDDTIKITNVADHSEMLANTLLRPFRPVPGMAELYAGLARRGAVFHYVSGSPWQLYGPLAEFLQSSGFPPGTFHLKALRLSDPTSLAALGEQQATKLRAIEELLGRYPGRRFLLLGDSGEQDPEIYGRVAREHAEQVVGIAIRNVSGAAPDSPRMVEAMKDLPAARWALFDRAQRIEPVIDRWLAEDAKQ